MSYYQACEDLLDRRKREPRLIQKVDQDPKGCWVACISALTGIPLNELPKAPNEEEPVLQSKLFTLYHNAVVKELSKRSWSIAYTGPRVPFGYSIATGPSPRHPDDVNRAHCVIVFDGKFVWDPHPSRLFIPSVREYEVLIPLAQPYIHAEAW